MNERIRKLAEQAKIDYELLPEIAREPVWIALDDELDKFAELIVRECLKIAKNREDEFESAGLLDESNAVGNVAYRISRQFGVER
jgi:hypothetical protein